MQATQFHPKGVQALRVCAALTLLLIGLGVGAQDESKPPPKRERAATAPTASITGKQPKAAAASAQNKAVAADPKAGARSAVQPSTPDRPSAASPARGAATAADPRTVRPPSSVRPVEPVVPERSREFTAPSTAVPVAAASPAASQPDAAILADDARLRHWTLPAASVIAAAASAAAQTPPLRRRAGVTLSPAAQKASALSVLRRHGYDAAGTTALRQGLPTALLADPLRSQALLTELRERDRAQGSTAMMRRAPSQNTERETNAAIAQLASNGSLAALTAGELLADEAARKAASQRCQRASIELDRQELNVRAIGLDDPTVAAGTAQFWSSVQALNPKAAEQYRRAAGAYAQACLDSSWQSLTVEQRTSMRAVVGHVLRGDAHVCMGARIARDRFLTARHCLYAYDEVLQQWLPRSAASLQVALIGNASVRYAATQLDCSVPQPDASCITPADNPLTADHIVLKLAPRSRDATPVALPAMPALAIERPSLSQFLVVPGHSTWITGRGWTPADEVYVTTAAVSGCMVAELASGCVVNSCQSESGFSGAPMLARRNVKELVMVGIFLGTANEYEHCRRSDRNFGAAPPQHVLAGGK